MWDLCIVVYLMYLGVVSCLGVVVYCLVLSSSELCCPRSGATAPCPVYTPVRGLFFLRRVRGCAKECCRGMVGMPGICSGGAGVVAGGVAI